MAILLSRDKIVNWTHDKLLLASGLHGNCLSCFCSHDSCQPGQESCPTLVQLPLVPTHAPRSSSARARVPTQLRKGSTILKDTPVLPLAVANSMLAQKLKKIQLNFTVKTKICCIMYLLTPRAQGCHNGHCCAWQSLSATLPEVPGLKRH